VSARSGASAIWRMDADGRNPREVLPAPEASNVTITPDGRWLVFTGTSGGMIATWKAALAGGEATLLARGLTRAAPSPDGRFVAGIQQDESAGALQLVVMSIDGGAPTRRYSPMPLTNTGVGGVGWTQDGQSLLFTAAERLNVWRQPLSGGPAVRVTGFQDGG